MARPLRTELPGALYLVTTRGVPGARVFRDEADILEFLSIYAQVESRMHWRLYAYALLDDHYHLVVDTPKPNLSRGMRQLNGVYTQHYNQRHGTSGKVFQGRFKAILVDRAEYLRPVLREVLNAPASARIRQPERYAGSSLGATLGLTPAPDWLDVQSALQAFGKTAARGRAALKTCLAAKPEFSIWERVRSQIYLGGDAFIGRVQRRAEAPAAKTAKKPLALKKFVSGIRDPKLAMAKAYLSGHYKMDQIAELFGVHYSTVSRAVKSYENRAV